MRDKGGFRACAKWACMIGAVVTACAWLGTRFAAIDIQTGTPLIVTLDQGMAIFVTGDAPVDWPQWHRPCLCHPPSTGLSLPTLPGGRPVFSPPRRTQTRPAQEEEHQVHGSQRTHFRR